MLRRFTRGEPVLLPTGSGVLDFESLVSKPDFHRLLDFPYLKNEEEVTEFTRFVAELDVAGPKCDKIRSKCTATLR